MRKSIYFDNAATTVGKPECVTRAVTLALEKLGNPGRSGHNVSLSAANEIYKCREAISRLFGENTPENVVFTQNATLALNEVIFGYATDSMHILISDFEHNSVIRPVHALSNSKSYNGITYSVFNASGDDASTLYDFTSKIRPNTRLAVVTLASNVCGKILPIAKIADICKKRNITLVCDASQAAGCVPINAKALGIDVICFAGHKSLYGPQGTGGIVFCNDKNPRPMIFGGNGVNSANKDMQGDLPEMLEAGTLNTPGICGLCAGVNYITKIGIGEIYERNTFLIDKLTENLLNIDGITLYGLSKNRTPTLVFNKKGYTSEEICELLNERNIFVRGGLHCSPLAHVSLSTGNYGAVRASLSFTNTLAEVDAFSSVVSKL